MHVGTLSLGACVPLALAANAALNASIGAVLPQLTAQIAGLIEMQAAMALTPPSLAGSLTTVQALLVNLEAAIALGLPGIDFQVLAIASALAKLQADIGALGASVSFGAEFAAVLGAIGIDLYVFNGTVNRMGTELANGVAGGLPGGAAPTDGCTAVILAASTPESMAAISKFFQTAA